MCAASNVNFLPFSLTFSTRYFAASLILLNGSTILSYLYAMHDCLVVFAPSRFPLSYESSMFSDDGPSLRFSGRKSRRLSSL
ncbi:hypothetical protein AR158_c395L [Paramecium bursaria Chlorella virus AR158]|uniref:hypothetical protein n=1 Tax=Paramecium bursaria Chlorella virus AR158 TaxID=380598 RepID=UPI00015AA6B4|nr:hypothetical protein AR158_c395L [Paramecium bursaria Chlorella virus AR158]ABU43940.1 hypothetical protein AR158_c395L [Paramecium bursaria Chlorella virus AR158]